MVQARVTGDSTVNNIVAQGSGLLAEHGTDHAEVRSRRGCGLSNVKWTKRHALPNFCSAGFAVCGRPVCGAVQLGAKGEGAWLPAPSATQYEKQ